MNGTRARVRDLGDRLGRNAKLLIARPGLDETSSGAEPLALRARDAGFEVVYQATGSTTEQLVQSAVEEGVHLVGLGMLSGSEGALVGAMLNGLRVAGVGDVPLVVVGSLPDEDARALEARGVARIYTPEAFARGAVMNDLVDVVRRAHGLDRGPF